MKISSFFLAATLSLASFSAFAETVNLNKADAAAFQHYLVGVGEVKSKNIVNYRKTHKKFKSVAEIKEVNGIGEAIYKKIKSSLSLTKGVTSAPVKATKKIKSNKKKVKNKATKTK